MRSLEFHKFDIEKSIKDNSAVVIVAKRNSGKSHLVKEIVYVKRDYPCVVVIAPTDKMNNFYASFIPSLYIHYEYSSEILGRIFQRQERLILQNKKRAEKGVPPLDTRLLLIMDDCLASKKLWSKDKNVYELLQNGRHYHITYILTMQYALGISPELRTNFDTIMLLHDDFGTNVKKLFDHYAGMFEDFAEFRRVFSSMTDNYGCMVLNMQSRSKFITDKVHWFRARAQLPAFVCGSDAYKRYSSKKFDKEWNDPSRREVGDAVVRGRGHVTLSLKK